MIQTRKELAMPRGILLGILMLLALSACAGEATPTVIPSTPSETVIPSLTPRPTLDYAQLTAYATYRPTLPATFTPTYTPSITPIPSSTPPATITPTREPMSELVLCPGFDSSPYAPQNLPVGITFTIPQDLILVIDTVNADTGEVIDHVEIPNQEKLTMVFDPARTPAGNYIWRASLNDETRTGLCAMEGTYTIVAQPTAQATTAATTVQGGQSSVQMTATALSFTATPRPREGRATEEAGN